MNIDYNGQKVSGKRFGRAIGFWVAVLFVLVGFFWMIETVEAGSVKVVKRFGGVTGRVLEPGFHLIVPFVDGTVEYNTKQVSYETADEVEQQSSQADFKDFPVETTSTEGNKVRVEYTIRFSVSAGRASEIAQNIGGQNAIVENVIKLNSRVVVRNIVRNYQAEELYTGQAIVKVQEEVFAQLQPEFEAKGIILDYIGIRDVDFDEQYAQAIEDKQVAEVQVQTETNKANQAEERKRATIADAEAQAEAQRLQRETLDTNVLRKLELEIALKNAEALKISAEKGQKIVPDFVSGGDASNFLYQLPTTSQ